VEWCGWKLASAVSNSGGLGLLSAGSMPPDLLAEHIRKCKLATNLPFGVNLPLLYPDIDKQIQVIVDEGVKIMFTSAGNPKLWTNQFQQHGIQVVHVVSSSKFAIKAAEAGCCAVVAEGFEAGGHNGREETTTLCLMPQVVQAVNIPVIAAGGIASGKAILAALALGAAGVQIGSLFACSKESSAHINFKKSIIKANEGDTSLVLKKLNPVRLIKNEFYNQVKLMEDNGAADEELKNILGKGRSKKGIFEGDIVEGELEIGQVSAGISEIKSVQEIMDDLWRDFLNATERLRNWKL
jgi:enoyl-[acyl-carrier protein] reductase II